MDGGATYRYPSFYLSLLSITELNFREEIVVNASGSKTLIALMNVRWAESKECRYEFNIGMFSFPSLPFFEMALLIMIQSYSL